MILWALPEFFSGIVTKNVHLTVPLLFPHGGGGGHVLAVAERAPSAQQMLSHRSE